MPEKLIEFSSPNEFFEKLIRVGVKYHASDIHITPAKEQIYIRFRIAGGLENFYSIGADHYAKLLNTIKIMADMAIDEHHHNQDGKIIQNMEVDSKNIIVNIRVSTLPTIYGENIVMRLLLSNSEYLDINKLGFSETNKATLEQIKDMGDGLVLLCGGTGSGKTTTLYSILQQFNPFKKTIFTLEDPVEYNVTGYIQSEVKEKKLSGDEMHYTFQEGLVGILRQDPDIIMIGEIRRKEEASICLEAANTGHLVMGSTHANSAIGAITRLKKLGVEPYLLASSLKYIIFQKLSRKLCDHCKKKIVFKKSDIPSRFYPFLHQDSLECFTAHSEGCEHCIKGFAGNTLLSEVIKSNDKLYNLILSEKGDVEIKNELFKDGYIPYYVDGLKKTIQGQIDIYDIIILE